MPALDLNAPVLEADGTYTWQPQQAGKYLIGVGTTGDDFGSGTVTVSQHGVTAMTATSATSDAFYVFAGYPVSFALAGATNPSITIIIQRIE